MKAINYKSGKSLICGLLAIAVLAVAAPASALTLKIATLAPSGSTWMEEMKAGAATIRKQTDGRVKIKFYPGGVMGDATTVQRKMRIGQLHGGAFSSSDLAHVFPDIQIYNLPMLFRSYEEVDFVRSKMDPYIRHGLKEAGYTTLGISNGGFAYFLSSKPMRSVEDFKGEKVWLPEGDRITGAIFDAADISPIALSVADVYTALQTGLLETIAGIPTGVIAFQWHTKVSYLTDVPLMFLVGVLAVDNKRFAKLSDLDQATVKSVMKDIFLRLDKLNRDDNDNAKQALAQQGIRFVKPNDLEMVRWQEITQLSAKALLAKQVYSEDAYNQVTGYLEEFRNPAEEIAAQ